MELPATPRRNCAITALAAMLLATPAADAAVGRTPGFASVSDDGEAVYSIPLDLPPGTNGLTPTLSLDYRHRARGGLLGVGWSVGGLSQITRCAKTIAQDGVAAPASRSPDTRFCLDGQRLVAVSGGSTPSRTRSTARKSSPSRESAASPARSTTARRTSSSRDSTGESTSSARPPIRASMASRPRRPAARAPGR